jgi:hypothetical protein
MRMRRFVAGIAPAGREPPAGLAAAPVQAHRPGLTGELHILKYEVRLHCKLGLLLGAIKPAIEREVHKEFDKRFNKPQA